MESEDISIFVNVESIKLGQERISCYVHKFRV